jgi:hypothetical protein
MPCFAWSAVKCNVNTEWLRLDSAFILVAVTLQDNAGSTERGNGETSQAQKKQKCARGLPSQRRRVLHELSNASLVRWIDGHHLNARDNVLPVLVLHDLVLGLVRSRSSSVVLRRAHLVARQEVFDLLAVDLDEADLHLKAPTSLFQLLLSLRNLSRNPRAAQRRRRRGKGEEVIIVCTSNIWWVEPVRLREE